MLGYLALDIICSYKIAVFLSFRKTTQTDHVRGQVSEHIFERMKAIVYIVALRGSYPDE